MAKQGVVVEAHLGVQRDQLARAGHDQRIDLGQAAIGLDEHAAERLHELIRRADRRAGSPSFAASLRAW